MEEHRTLVVDDEPEVAAALAKLIDAAGHNVVGRATSGEDAIRLNESLEPDVVLLDLQMPRMGGLEVAKHIMDSRPVPIVVCTAFFDDKLIKDAAETGVHGYVVKPCRLADLVPAMNVAVSRFEEVRLLKAEIESLKETLAARKWIEQAKGIVMRTRHMEEDEAHKFLQQQSQRRSLPLVEIARAIVMADETLGDPR